MASNWAASALDWWEEAGVDTIVGEAPRDWLAPKAKAADTTPAAPPPDALPNTLDDFHAWLGETDQLPYAAPSALRAAPSGDAACGVMILTDMPSSDGGLISGRGRRTVRQDARRDRAEPRHDLPRRHVADPQPGRDDRRGGSRAACGDRAPPYRPRRAEGAAAVRRRLRQGIGRHAASPARAHAGTRFRPPPGRSGHWSRCGRKSC